MFDTLLAEFGNRDKQFTVYRKSGETDIESQFSTRGVRITHEKLPASGPEPFVVIEEDDDFAGALPVTQLEMLTEPPIVRPDERDRVSDGFRVLFDVFDETVFTAMDRRQLLAVTREIEDRAFRVGTGRLRVSFQSLSTFDQQVELYRQLATATKLEIHIYGRRDWDPPAIPGVTYHGFDDETGERYWILAFDGGDRETQACGLLAEEKPEGYDGLWTYDPELVGKISDGLAAMGE